MPWSADESCLRRGERSHDDSEQDIELDVFSVDRAGNMSEEPKRVSVHIDARDEGCRLSRGNAGDALPWLFMLGLAIGRRRRAF